MCGTLAGQRDGGYFNSLKTCKMRLNSNNALTTKPACAHKKTITHIDL
jgi:hypothetical protein